MFRIFNKNKKAELGISNVKTNVKEPKLATAVVDKAVAQTRKDIKEWNTAQQLTKIEDNPKWYLLQQLFKEIRLDALLTSQYKNRQLKALSQRIILKKPNGEVDEDQTKILNDALFTHEINRHILDSKYEGYSLIEFYWETTEDGEDVLKVKLVPRANIDPKNGAFYADYTEDKKIMYRDASEFGTWLLEFGEENDYGLLNNAVPHVLFKKFAQSCLSEYCEIAGIPPRVLKTNTQDSTMIKRAEKMMTDMGSASWFIIDEAESFEWANPSKTDGAVYSTLISLCNNEISMLMSGAIIGQDTKNGSRSKDESSQDMLQVLIDSDLRLLEQYWNDQVIPALIRIGVLKGELTYGYEQAEDLDQLWTMTKEVLPFKNVDNEWIKEKFGVEVTGDKVTAPTEPLKQTFDFFD